MKIPSINECFKLIKQMDMMAHIVEHSIMVSNVAMVLSKKIKKVSPAINTRLTVRAALLHDITKTRSFNTHERHSETGGQLLSRMGYPEIGNIIRQHVILDNYEELSPISEPEIVNYSDKRVLHDKVVSLDRRLDYIKQQYGTAPEFRDRIQVMWENTIALEDKIFLHLDITPDQLSGCIKDESACLLKPPAA